jgi:hypothetical protein
MFTSTACHWESYWIATQELNLNLKLEVSIQNQSMWYSSGDKSHDNVSNMKLYIHILHLLGENYEMPDHMGALLFLFSSGFCFLFLILEN